jgi:GT2 family glycosyltransferase
VVIPTRDPGRRLAVVLDGLGRTDWPDIEVIIVDNGSRDPDSLELIATSGAVVVRRDIPFNFSRLANSGASAGSGEYLLLLNDDVEVIAADWMRRLVALAARPDVGPVAPLLLFPDGTIQHCGIGLADGAPFHPEWRKSPDEAAPELVRGQGPRWAVTAACLVLRHELFDRLGGMDALLHTNYNDVDLCLRSTRVGAVPYIDADARLIHHESLSRGTGVTPELAADWLMFRTRWAGAWGGASTRGPGATQ